MFSLSSTFFIDLNQQTLPTLERCGKMLIWWLIIAVIVFLITLSLGLFSHPLTRVLKRLKKLQKKAEQIESKIKLFFNYKKTILLLKELKILERSVQKALNVYVYDDKEECSSSVQEGSVYLNAIVKEIDSCIDFLEKKDKDGLINVMEKIKNECEKASKVFSKIIDEDKKNKLLKV